jgi:CRISPR-associated protein Csx3
MTNVELTLIPTPEGFQLLDILIGGNGIADHRELSQLELPEDLDWRKGVILNGRGPIWLYAYLAHLCHPAAWLAVMDPRHGAIVVEAHHPDAPPVASTISLDQLQQYLPRHARDDAPARKAMPGRVNAVAFVGPPHSGKSVLLRAVYRDLQNRLPIDQFQREVFLIRACPDNEGLYFSDIPADRIATLHYKSNWDEAFAAEICQNLENLGKTKRLLLADLGGKIDHYTQQILNRCTHAVIVSRDLAAVLEWRGALEASETALVAEVHSVPEETCETLSREPLQLRLGPLDRERELPILPDALVEAVRMHL